MEIPRYAPREPGGPPPAIYIENPNRFDRYGGSSRSHPHPSNFSSTLASIPMSIPNHRQRAEDEAPPPLPPPKHIPGMGAPPPPPPPHSHDRIPSIDSNEGWDSSRRGFLHDRSSLDRRGSDLGMVRSQHKDEGYHSLNSTISSIGSQDSLPKTLFMSHDQYRFNKPNVSDYDNSLLKKLDSRRTFDNRSPPRRSALSSSANDAASRYGGTESRLHSQLPSLSLPIRSSNKHVIDSPGRFTDTPLQTALSPRSTPFHGTLSNEYRSPIEPMDTDRLPFSRSRRNNSDDATVSTHSSYENNTDDTEFPMDRFHIDDSLSRSEYQAVGQKRRASSPPGDDLQMQGVAGSCELLRRREGLSRASPTPRLTIPPSSIPNTSYTSNASLGTSTISSISFGARSPGGLSSGCISPVDVISNSPYNTPISLTHSPRISLSRVPHQRNLSTESRQLASPRKVTEAPKPSISKVQGGFFMCECCPKKPKKFETAEELSAHEAEKQYECSFCGNRFKNKNEAERHQNSLHVRRHSWSCSALLLAGIHRAFHDSTNRPGEADTCGYCGEEFARSGTGGQPRTRHTTEQDWDERHRHLQEVHKFRECNSSKKFYRADHFRQHLKHSHAGTSGKWTNLLENSCMMEEDPPVPRR
ncbi:hypothetical protein F4778DRAFT_450038 [Xylariomycetidae sp. FL2044]|nr:hypothetical protein F4778DRAFT_450038 [Xylariomycetidae sp. FL2044]